MSQMETQVQREQEPSPSLGSEPSGAAAASGDAAPGAPGAVDAVGGGGSGEPSSPPVQGAPSPGSFAPSPAPADPWAGLEAEPDAPRQEPISVGADRGGANDALMTEIRRLNARIEAMTAAGPMRVETAPAQPAAGPPDQYSEFWAEMDRRQAAAVAPLSEKLDAMTERANKAEAERQLQANLATLRTSVTKSATYQALQAAGSTRLGKFKEVAELAVIGKETLMGRNLTQAEIDGVVTGLLDDVGRGIARSARIPARQAPAAGQGAAAAPARPAGAPPASGASRGAAGGGIPETPGGARTQAAESKQDKRGRWASMINADKQRMAG